MFKLIGVAVSIVIAAVLILAAMQPDNFVVQRSITVQTPPDKIYPFINDFHRWAAWSPFEKLDPAMQRVFSGTEAGKGAIYEWSGDKNAGKGRMEIIDATAPNNISIQLDFSEPFAAHNTTEFTLAPNGETTTVTWAMRGSSPFIAKIMQLFCNMDKMIGPDFEEGLANLKMLAERN
jgi:carbon monoxide dehydrogenase subunit G